MCVCVCVCVCVCGGGGGACGLGFFSSSFLSFSNFLFVFCCVCVRACVRACVCLSVCLLLLFVFACVFPPPPPPPPLFLLSIGLIQIVERAYAVSEFSFLLGLMKYLFRLVIASSIFGNKDTFVEVRRFVTSFRRATIGGWGGYSVFVLVTDRLIHVQFID